MSVCFSALGVVGRIASSIARQARRLRRHTCSPRRDSRARPRGPIQCRRAASNTDPRVPCGETTACAALQPAASGPQARALQRVLPRRRVPWCLSGSFAVRCCHAPLHATRMIEASADRGVMRHSLRVGVTSFDSPAGKFHALESDRGGRPLVFLHGFPDHPPTAARSRPSSRRAAIAWSRRGCAATRHRRASGRSISTARADVIALIDAGRRIAPSISSVTTGARCSPTPCARARTRAVVRAVTLAMPHPLTFLRRAAHAGAGCARAGTWRCSSCRGAGRLAGAHDFALIDRLWRTLVAGLRGSPRGARARAPRVPRSELAGAARVLPRGRARRPHRAPRSTRPITTPLLAAPRRRRRLHPAADTRRPPPVPGRRPLRESCRRSGTSCTSRRRPRLADRTAAGSRLGRSEGGLGSPPPELGSASGGSLLRWPIEWVIVQPRFREDLSRDNRRRRRPIRRRHGRLERRHRTGSSRSSTALACAMDGDARRQRDRRLGRAGIRLRPRTERAALGDREARQLALSRMVPQAGAVATARGAAGRSARRAVTVRARCGATIPVASLKVRCSRRSVGGA